MATVTMDIAELKKLESQIQTLENDKQELISRQKQVLVLHKYFEAEAVPRAGKTIQITGIKTFTNWENCSPIKQYFTQETFLKDLVAQGLVDLKVIEDNTKTSLEYVNLSEVITKISGEKESELKESIDQYRDRALKAEENLRTSTEDSELKLKRFEKSAEEKILKLTEENVEAVKQLNESHKSIVDTKNTEYVTLLQQYDDLKDDKKRISLEQQIAELTKALADEKAKSFWKKLFS